MASEERQEVEGLWQAEPDWTSLPEPLPTPAELLFILFIGASNRDDVKLNLEEEVKKIEEKFTKETRLWLNSSGT